MYRSRSQSTRRREEGSSSSSRMQDSRSRSTSRRRTDSSSRSRSRSRLDGRSESRDSHKSSFLKGSLGLLAGIGIAAYAAHKIWPKGILYGGKEDWETREPPPKQPSRRLPEYRRPRDDDALYERDPLARREQRSAIRGARAQELPQQRGRSANRESWTGPQRRELLYEPTRSMLPRRTRSNYRRDGVDGAFQAERPPDEWGR